MIGKTLSHYEVLEKIGEGGMGVVYRARDPRLERLVAIKVLRPETVGDPDRKRRFVREAKAASALNHPAIVVIHDIGESDGLDFIAMELVEGESLDRVLDRGTLPVAQALAYAGEIASALAAAHQAGIVHRDVKPGNVMVTPSGRIKVLDFGLAKLVEREGAGPSADSFSPTATGGDPRTQQGVVLGTLAYLSPEQAEGKPVDARSDVFSFGTMLYEMLAKKRPFQGASTIGTLTAILRDDPAPVRTIRPDVSEPLARVLTRCLEKKPEARYASASELARDLASLQSPPAAAGRASSLWRRPAVFVPALALLLAAIGFGLVSRARSARAREAHVGLSEIPQRMEAQDLVGVFRRLSAAEREIPQDPELRRALGDTVPFTIQTDPPGARVSFASYLQPEAGWEVLGVAPIEGVRLPFGFIRLRAEKSGYETLEASPIGSEGDDGSIRQDLKLEPKGSSPEGMVRIPAGRHARLGMEPFEVPEYWLDRMEVTNRRYKAFVDGGGYSDPRFWKEPFVKDGRAIAFAQAMALLRDSTGRPGPATWELGGFSQGREEQPVAGVSWYEAAAYAEWAGKTLPTVHHWYRATEQDIFSEILKFSNFNGDGPVRVGSLPGLGPYGTYDMAGNVKEWCANAWEGKRYIAGGSWSDPVYLYAMTELADPWDRAPTNGLRCAQEIAPTPPALTQAVLLEPKEDLSKLKPAGDEEFKIYAGLYEYEKLPLRERVDRVDESSPHWKREAVSYDAAYGGERITAHLYLPRNARPPYQTVVYFPDSSAEAFRSSQEPGLRWVDFVIRSGRALMFPVYKGTYERRGTGASNPSGIATLRRDLVLAWSKDLGRSLDYLETRPDIARGTVAFYGFSLGAVYAPVLCAMEPRLRSCILVGGGLSGRKLPPEADPINFVPRVTMPVLMIGGRDDFVRPVATAQAPLFRLLGTPEKDKRHALLEGGHLPPRLNEMIREILDWLDRYQGPVQKTS